MMKVFYAGNMKGYHVIGKSGIALAPGVNEVDWFVGKQLLHQKIVQAVEEVEAIEEVIEEEPAAMVEEFNEETSNDGDDELGGQE